MQHHRQAVPEVISDVARALLSESSPVTSRRGFQLLLLTLALMAVVYAKAALGPLQETMRLSLGLSDNQIALLQGPALALPMLVAAVPLGLLIDRYSRVRILFALVVIAAVGSALTAIAPNFSVLAAARALVGLAAFALAPTAFSLLADLYEPAERGRAGMVVLVGQFAGVSAVFAVGGVLVTNTNWTMEPWRGTMLWLTCPLVLVVLLLLASREPRRSDRIIQNPSARESFIQFWNYRSVIGPLLLGKLMALIALGSVMIWAAPTLARKFGLPPDSVGAVMAVTVPLGGISGTVLGGIIADICQRAGGPRRTMAVLTMLAVVSTPAALFGLMPNVLTSSVLLVLLLALLTAISTIGATLLIVTIPNEIRGLVVGVLTGIASFLSVGLAPLLVSLLSGAMGGPAMVGRSVAGVCMAAGLLSAITFAWGRRYFAISAAVKP